MYKLVISSALLLAMIATTFCYDFDDSYYNLILATDLEEMQESLDYSAAAVGEHPRARRDEEAAAGPKKCRRRLFKECCDTEFIETLHNREKEHKNECFKEIHGKDKDAAVSPPDPFKCDKVNKHRKDMMCFLQCMAQKRNLAGPDGNLKEAPFTAYVRDNFKESWLVSHLDTIIHKCLAEARNATASRNKRDMAACNPAAIKGEHCLFREIQLSCPEEQIKNNKTCAKFKERVKQHGDLAPALQTIKH